MVQYLLSTVLLTSLYGCGNLPETKQQIQKEGKELAKQVKAAVEHFDPARAYIGYEARPGSSIRLYWKDDKGDILGSLGKLKQYIGQKGDSLLYACNGGMYMENRGPLGGYTENGKMLQKINTRTGSGNFYLKPKAVFYVLANGRAGVQSVETQKDRTALPAGIRYLTQSGPMLVNRGSINPVFTPGSTNINVRNGVGILPGGNAYFAMSTYPVSFYDFAKHFADKGCKEALYFDGFVSRSYCPEENYTQLGGNFGVMVAVIKQ